jgi:DNA repair protein RecO (recombination protein O)
MEWNDEGIVISARRHGESSTLVSLLTRNQGRHAGLMRGGSKAATRGVLQIGNRVKARWRARLAEHLGTIACELSEAVAAPLIHDPDRLACLVAACSITETALPEREPYPRAFERLLALLCVLTKDGEWLSAYVKWELGLLSDLGFGLDLDHCVVTGRKDQLAFVSPKSGCAVSKSAGEPFRGRLLALPAFLLESDRAGDVIDAIQGLALTGFFLERYVYHAHGQNVPKARVRFIGRLQRACTSP